MAPKMFLTRLVSVAVVSKLYTSRFVFLFSRRYFLLRNFLEIVKLFTKNQINIFYILLNS